jgi:tetratricopeptide (TPR) repeat protein
MSDPANAWRTRSPALSVAIILDRNVGLHDTALYWLKKGHEMYPDDIESGYEYARALLIRNPQSPDAYAILAGLFNKDPLLHLDDLLTIAMDDNDPNLALLLLQRLYKVYCQQPKLVTERYSLPTILECFRTLAVTLWKQKSFRDAEEVCKTIIELDPQPWDNRYVLAQVYASAGENDRVIAICSELIGEVPGAHWPYELAAEAFAKKGLIDSSRALLTTCLREISDADAKKEVQDKLQSLQYLKNKSR